MGSGDESAHGPESKVGMDSKGVSGERRVGSEVRLGVGIGRGPTSPRLASRMTKSPFPWASVIRRWSYGSLATRAARRRLPGV